MDESLIHATEEVNPGIRIATIESSAQPFAPILKVQQQRRFALCKICYFWEFSTLQRHSQPSAISIERKPPINVKRTGAASAS
jgi:hypothetical protein